MAKFLVTYRSTPSHAVGHETFIADEVVLEPNENWFTFMVGNVAVDWVHAHDVRTIENLTGDRV